MKLQRVDKILVAWLIIVFALIVWPFPDIPEVAKFDYSDKIGHMILFGIVTFLVNGSMQAKGFRRKTSTVIGFMAGSSYAGIAEIIQIFVTGRNCSIYDFYAGSIGAAIALIVIYIRRTQKEIKQHL